MRRRLAALLACTVVALFLPVASLADHIVTSGTVSARLKERRSTDFWTVEISWAANCTGAAPGTAWYDGELYLVDADTGERIHAGGVVDTSGRSAVSGKRDWFVASVERPRILFRELTIHCYENFPLHGGREVKTTGPSVFIPPRFSSGGGPAAAAATTAPAIRPGRWGAAAAPRRSLGRTTATRSPEAEAATSSSGWAPATASRVAPVMTA